VRPMSKQARIKTQELRKAQEEAARRTARRRRILTILGGLLIGALVVAIVVVVVRAVGGSDDNATPTELVPPANVTPSGAIPVGNADAPVTVEIYYDYMCPACGAFEAANSAELDRLMEAGTAKVELRPISILDRFSNGTQYSTRSANAIATVADGSPNDVWALHKVLYEEQPEEGSDGLSDDKIAELATDAGVPSDVVDRFSDRTYFPWVAESTQTASDSGVQGTPTVLINGEVFTGNPTTTGPLTEAIETAAAE
jgi:protein-disulfide isomerase